MLSGDFTPGPIFILGTNLADTLVGTAAGDVINGYGGNDSVSGGDGNDTIDGGSGTNRIDGGAGDDLIVIDRRATNGVMMTPATGIDGGLGYDTVSFAGTMAEFHVTNIVGYGLTITDLVGAARTIAVGVEHLRFTDGDIWLSDPNVTAPVVSGMLTGATVEGGLPVSLSLLANASDPDFGAILSVSAIGPVPTGVTYAGGVLTLDPVGFEYLGAGVTEVVTISYQVSDGLHQTEAFAQISITGENDAATFDGTMAVIGEDDTGFAATVAVTDIDSGEAALATLGVFASAHGVFAVDAAGWSFCLDADLLDVQALATGQALSDRLAVASVDGTDAELIVTVAGVSDVLRIGTDLAETVNGTAAADRLFGLGGTDVLNGKGGADVLDGGAGADKLYGADGTDRVIWDGADRVTDGGGGVDTLVLRSGVTVTLSTADQVAGDTGVTRGFEAVDARLCLTSVSLAGSDAANRLLGGYANDLLAGGRGADVLTGGMGADTFLFAARGGVDHVTDFALGQDHLGIQGRTAAQVSWSEIGSDTRVDLGSTVVMLDGVLGLSLSDFLFL